VASPGTPGGRRVPVSVPRIPAPALDHIVITALVGDTTYVLGRVDITSGDEPPDVCDRLVKLLRHLARQAAHSSRLGDLEFGAER
jgi:hypothetical protein